MSAARVALWRSRSLRFLMGASATLVNGLTGIIRNKWLAQHLDVSGIGIMAQVISSQIWLGTAGGPGVSPPGARPVGGAAPPRDSQAPRPNVLGPPRPPPTV